TVAGRLDLEDLPLAGRKNGAFDGRGVEVQCAVGRAVAEEAAHRREAARRHWITDLNLVSVVRPAPDELRVSEGPDEEAAVGVIGEKAELGAEAEVAILPVGPQPSVGTFHVQEAVL